MIVKYMIKNFRIISAVLTGLFIVLFIYAGFFKSAICSASDSHCWQVYNLIVILLLEFPVIFIVAITSSFLLKNEHCYSVVRATLNIFIPVYISIVLLTPWDIGSGLAGPSFSKGLMALLLSLVYFIVAIIYILILRAKEKK